MAGCGYAPGEIDVMPMTDVFALLDHWRTHPPTHEVLAAALGLERAAPRNSDDPSNIGSLITRFPEGAIKR